MCCSDQARERWPEHVRANPTYWIDLAGAVERCEVGLSTNQLKRMIANAKSVESFLSTVSAKGVADAV